jgi:Flp pilus assembly protein TadG
MNVPRRRLRGDDGLSSVEFALVFPAALLLVLLVVHVSLLLYASHVAGAAADRGLQTVQAEGGTVANATAEAHDVADHAGLVASSDVDVNGTATQVKVTVTVHVSGVLPFLPDTVTRSESGPVERFVPEGSSP